MQFERISASAVLVHASVEEAREAAWYALKSERIAAPLIDVERNIVSGLQGDGVLTTILVATVYFESKPKGTVVSFESLPALGSRDFSAPRRAKKLANALERVLNSGHFADPVNAQIHAPAPLAAPSGAGHSTVTLVGHPVYGTVLAPKRGMTLLCYGILGLICCPIMAPLTLAYAIRTLKDYERRGDPGDKSLVFAALFLASGEILLLMGWLVLLVL